MMLSPGDRRKICTLTQIRLCWDVHIISCCSVLLWHIYAGAKSDVIKSWRKCEGLQNDAKNEFIMAHSVPATEDRNQKCSVKSNRIRVCNWSGCFLTTICFGAPLPSVCILQDKQLGDGFLRSSLVKSQRGNLFPFALCWWILIGWKAHIYMHCASYLLWATQSVTSEVSVSGQGQTRPDKVETTSTQNITGVIYMVCFGLANIISTLPFFKYALRALEADGRSWFREYAVYGSIWSNKEVFMMC